MEQKQKFINYLNYIRTIKGENIPYKEFANALSVQPGTINKKISRNSMISQEEIKLLNNYFDIKDTAVLDNDKIIKIGYYENEKITSLIQNPLIKEFYLDSSLIRNIWRIDPYQIRLIAMPGDKMEAQPTSHLHIRNRDVLLMDTSSRNINISGIYAYETLNGTKLQISNVSVMTDGNIRFYYANQIYNDEIRTPERLKELGFNVIGRIIKNICFVHV